MVLIWLPITSEVNNITIICSGTFDDLTSLSVLYLNDNNITEIPSQVNNFLSDKWLTLDIDLANLKITGGYDDDY